MPRLSQPRACGAVASPRLRRLLLSLILDACCGFAAELPPPDSRAAEATSGTEFLDGGSALSADDECADEVGQHGSAQQSSQACSVSALQLRASGGRGARRETSEAEQPSWICVYQPWLCPQGGPGSAGGGGGGGGGGAWHLPWGPPWQTPWGPPPQPQPAPTAPPAPPPEPAPAPAPAPPPPEAPPQTTTPTPASRRRRHGWHVPDLCDVMPFMCSRKNPSSPSPGAGPSPVPILPPSRWPAALRSPSDGKLYTFYMYRVQGEDNYPQPNHDMTNLAGAMWYLHNEIVWHDGGRSGTYFSSPVTRILKFKIQMKATQPLLDMGMNYGVFNAFDSGQCTGPFKCDNFQKSGYVIGCETWVPGPTNFPHSQWNKLNYYEGATWYSLPGQCTTKTYKDKTPECVKDEPGGMCPAGQTPTGTYDCTWTYEQLGEITINDIEGIDNVAAFYDAGGREYNPKTDQGTHMSFWNNLRDTKACARRVAHAEQLFHEKYPDQPDLEAPGCDFNKFKFYPDRDV